MRFFTKFALVVLFLAACVQSSHQRPVPRKLANRMPAAEAGDLPSGIPPMAKEVTEETMSTTEDKENGSLYDKSEDYPQPSKEKDFQKKKSRFLSKIKKFFAVEKEPETGMSEDYLLPATEEPFPEQIAVTAEIVNVMVEKLTEEVGKFIPKYSKHQVYWFSVAASLALVILILCTLGFCCLQWERQQRQQWLWLQQQIDELESQPFEEDFEETEPNEKGSEAETKDSSVLGFIRKVFSFVRGRIKMTQQVGQEGTVQVGQEGTVQVGQEGTVQEGTVQVGQVTVQIEQEGTA
ncbi:uncharacterized protein [Aquarana catesbeiana]|uniref:uncharacterized protein n=1 Tax=Aquarana catesbeiana TaxID=8400 RepID=UPI003CCA48C7